VRLYERPEDEDPEELADGATVADALASLPADDPRRTADPAMVEQCPEEAP